MRSEAMWGLKLAVLLVLVGVAAGALTIEQTLENGCTADLQIQCKSLQKDFGPQTLKSGEVAKFTVFSTLDDPSLSCDFLSATLVDLKTKKTVEIWNYLNSGFTDFPWMSCTGGCTWKPQDDGIYYRALDGSFVIFIKWAAIITPIPA